MEKKIALFLSGLRTGDRLPDTGPDRGRSLGLPIL